MKRKVSSVNINLLDLIPTRNRKWERSSDDRVIILQPKFKNNRLTSWLIPRLRQPNFRIKLDEFGSWVWMQCDGNTTVENIGQSLRKKFGDRVEPVYDRLAFFLRQLEKSKFIAYLGKQQS